jgi:hypothetical protein
MSATNPLIAVASDEVEVLHAFAHAESLKPPVPVPTAKEARLGTAALAHPEALHESEGVTVPWYGGVMILTENGLTPLAITGSMIAIRLTAATSAPVPFTRFGRLRAVQQSLATDPGVSGGLALSRSRVAPPEFPLSRLTDHDWHTNTQRLTNSRILAHGKPPEVGSGSGA